MNVMGQKRSDDEILEIVKKFSDDKKNNSLELNEFIKMIAVDVKRDATGNQEELLDAFRWGQVKDDVIMFQIFWCPLIIDDCDQLNFADCLTVMRMED